jgi:short-subunit dehydrogenase involved in D-alanine esterification of teichoic acids
MYGIVPTDFADPVFCATRGFTHAWTMALRTQLRAVRPEVRVVEIVAPAVGPAWGMTPDAFVAAVATKLMRGEETFGVGPAEEVVMKWFGTYGVAYNTAEGQWKPPSA